MRVLVYTYFPPHRRHLAGGAQRMVDMLLTLLATDSTEITVVCPGRGARDLVADHANLRVLDVLNGVDEEVSPAQRHRDAVLLRQQADLADVIVTIDRPFPVDTETPVVLSLNNFSYDRESRSVFALGWDAIVVPSPYLNRCVDWFFGAQHWRGLAPPVYAVPCAVSLGANEPLSASAQREILGSTKSAPFLAFPHRPDPNKGFETALRATLELRDRGMHHTLLVPAYPLAEAWPEQRTHLRQRRELVTRLGAEHAVRFHRWVEADEMAGYLGAADWSLCLSELPEGFGLGVIEGVLAGTPVIATPAGAIPDLLPAYHGVSITEFRDHESVADIVAAGSSSEEIAAGRGYIGETYDVRSIAHRWMVVLLQTVKSKSPYDYVPSPTRRPPWLRKLASGRDWDDYARDYVSVVVKDQYSIALFTTKGIEDICIDELVDTAGCSRSDLYRRDKLVLVRAEVPPKKLRNLRTVDDVGVVLAQPAPVDSEAALRTYLDTWLTRDVLVAAAEACTDFDETFSVTATVARSPLGAGQVLDAILTEHIVTTTGWRPRELERAALDVRVFVDRTWLFIARRLFEVPLTVRSYRTVSVRGALRPTVAAAMVRLTPAVHGKRRLWDPYCGSGTILAEAALLGNEVWGTDIDDEAVAASRENVGGDQPRQLEQDRARRLHDASRVAATCELRRGGCEHTLGQADRHRQRSRALRLARDRLLRPALTRRHGLHPDHRS